MTQLSLQPESYCWSTEHNRFGFDQGFAEVCQRSVGYRPARLGRIDSHSGVNRLASLTPRQSMTATYVLFVVSGYRLESEVLAETTSGWAQFADLVSEPTPIAKGSLRVKAAALPDIDWDF